MIRIKFILLLSVAFYCSLHAQTIITDRPDQTESSSTVEAKSLQIETGIVTTFEGENEFEVRQLLAPTSLFRIGLTSGVELRVLSQWEKMTQFERAQSGISDLEVGTKIQLLKKAGIKTEVAFLTHLVIPTGSRTVTGDKFGSINKLSVSHEIANGMGFGYNVGYNRFEDEEGDLTYSFALGFGITQHVSVYIEPYGCLIAFDEHVANFDAGVTYLLKDNLQLDYSFGSGINHKMNYMSLGASWNISNRN